jgi:hypothetical protein
MKSEDIDAVASSFVTRRLELSKQDDSTARDITPLAVEFNPNARARDVVSIDSSYVVLFKDPSYPLWIVATRVAMIRRRYDPEGPRYVMLGNDYEDEIDPLDGTNPAIVENESVVEIFPDRDGKVNEASVEQELRHKASRAEEVIAKRIASENEGIMILFDGSLVASNKTMMDIVKTCEEHGNVIVGISKDSKKRDINNISLDERILAEYSTRNPGFTGYQLLHDGFDTGIGTCFARLHPKAVKWFRIDYMANTEQMTVSEMLNTIACYSQVNTQPGNPFPPLTAHEVAVKIRQYKVFVEEYLMKALKREGVDSRYIASGLTNINGKPVSGTFHDYLDLFTKIRGIK